MPLPPPEPPDALLALARARAAARAARDWTTADARKAEIEAAGWKVIDRGLDFSLEPAAPATVEVDGVVRYGSAAAVPSLLGEPASAAFTVLLLADERATPLAAVLAGLAAHAPAGTQVVIVANDPDEVRASRLVDLPLVAGESPEVVWTSARLGAAAAWNVGIARARGAVVILADGTSVPTGDALTPAAEALAEPTVAVVGAEGRASRRLPRFEPSEGPDVDAIALSWLAVRRDDLVAVGPLDEKLAGPRYLDAWLSLALRSGGDDGPVRAGRRIDLPLSAAPAPSEAPSAPRDAERIAKRDGYRLLNRFGHRPDLLSGGGGTPSPAGG